MQAAYGLNLTMVDLFMCFDHYLLSFLILRSINLSYHNLMPFVIVQVVHS